MSLARRSLCGALLFVPVAHAQFPDFQYAQNSTDGRWYGFSPAPMTRDQAHAAAFAFGGSLASIGSSAEQTWIQNTFAPYSAWRYWIGLNDLAVEGQYVWANGEPVVYTNWAPGQPDNAGGNQDGVQLEPGSSWRWSDVNVDTSTTTKPLAEIVGTPRTGWTLPVSKPVGNSPSYAASGDFDGDGRADLVVPNTASNTVTVLRGQTSGALSTGVAHNVASGPQTAVVGDFDDDGFLDWAVACSGGDRVVVRYGDGGGGFPVSYEIVLSTKPRGLAAADFDGDGRTDLAATSTDSLDRLLVLRAAAGRTFEPAVAYATGTRPLHVTAGDLEGDGDVDLVVANESSDDIGIYRNQGAGSFVTSALLARGDGPRRIALLDVDADGLLDLAVPCSGQSFVRIHYATPGGSFVIGPAIAGGGTPTWCEAIDTTGDGVRDVVTGAFGTGEVLVQEVLPGGHLQPIATSVFAGSSVTCVLGLDLNHDGRRDLVAVGNSNARVVELTKLSRDCNTNGRDDDVDIELGSSTDCNGNHEPDECDLAAGGTFDCDANGLLDACEILATPSLDLDSDGTLDECEQAGTPYCFGDGTGATCPCDPGQAGAPGSGCRNSFGTGGRLAAVGNPSVSNDSVSLRASGLLNTTVGLFFQGNAWQNGGIGSSLGDGLLCANQMVVRLEIRFAVGGAMAFGRDVPTDPSIAADGFVPAVGATRYYQVWYRDPAPYCTASTFNLTNGVRVVWTP